MLRKNCASMLSATAEMNMPMRVLNSLSEMPRITASSIKFAGQAKQRNVLISIKNRLVQGIDYGKLPNKESSSLLRPGAEKICRMMALRQKIILINANQDSTNKLIYFIIKVELINVDGLLESEGIGTCNSAEQKFSHFNAFDIANIVLKIAHERALIEAINARIDVQDLLNKRS